MKYGMEGYGLYWYCLELIASNVELHNLTFELEHDAQIIAHDTGIHSDVVQDMMKYMIELGLFESDGITVTCMKMATRTDEYTSKLLRKTSGHSPDNVPTLSRHSPDKVPPIRRERREEKRKEKVKKESSRFTPPTVEQVKEYCTARGNGVDPENFVDHYDTNGWMRGKTKIKDWKACVRTWEKNNKPAGSKQQAEKWT
jgi:hypothetical protein